VSQSAFERKKTFKEYTDKAQRAKIRLTRSIDCARRTKKLPATFAGGARLAPIDRPPSTAREQRANRRRRSASSLRRAAKRRPRSAQSSSRDGARRRGGLMNPSSLSDLCDAQKLPLHVLISRGNGVVPFWVEFVAFYVERRQFLVGDLDALWDRGSDPVRNESSDRFSSWFWRSVRWRPTD
jgi:hypothetical protein